MSLRRNLLIILSTALAATAAGAFLLVPALTQKMANQEKTTITIPPLRAPKIVIRKSERALELYDSEKLIKSYTVVLGFAPEGDKEREGDGKTPEGEFYLFTKNPESKFHLSLGVSYPSKDDAERGLEAGLISKSEHSEILAAIEQKKAPPQKTALGGEIYIHGGGVASDWTLGCIAMKNEEIEELFNAIPVGAPVTIRP